MRYLALSFYSKYCGKRIVSPDPKNEPEFTEFLSRTLANSHYDVFVPLRSDAQYISAKNQDILRGYTNLVLPDFVKMKIASDKGATFRLAREIGVDIPETYYITSPSDVDRIPTLSFPVVLKELTGSGSRGVAYILDRGQLDARLKNFFDVRGGERILLQEYIEGDGFGFFSLFRDGEPKAIFMHHRIREYPATGGPSVCAESYYDNRLRDAGLRILRHLGWNGVAMVEFKGDRGTGRYKLMEINPKFWGSLALGIASGVDFPYLYALQALDIDFDPVFDYKVGLRYRWLFPGDFLNWVSSSFLRYDFYADFVRKGVRYDISLRDPFPHLIQLLMVGGYIWLYRGKIRYPQGKPMRREK